MHYNFARNTFIYLQISLILQKGETSRTPEELRLLESFSDIVRAISKRKARNQLYKDRVIEKEDPIEVIERKSERLAQIISRAKHLVCYTGAGISTSAKIPDYRGSQGIWTLLQQGKEIGKHDLSLADPTYTHMALYELHRRKMLRFVVSQNCDGLHLRAGLPKASLSEVHGNMYVEVCKNCKPNVEYWRLFDTTELTARFYHNTNRRCHICSKPLSDTIVHFGERGNLKWPLNWAGACAHSEKADVILCIGSSLKVLKKYSWLWQMDRPLKKRAKLCVVNLQWTPKDKLATLKINGKCDDVMKLVMKYLNIKVPDYNRGKDPIFSHASLLCPEELHTVSQPMLKKIKKEEEEEEEPSCEENDNVLPAFSSSDTESRSAGDSENSSTPKKCFITDQKENTEDLRKKSLTPIKKPVPSPLKNLPIKSVPYVKTSLNSKHLILAEAEKSSSSEEDESDCEGVREKDDLKSDSDVPTDKRVASRTTLNESQVEEGKNKCTDQNKSTKLQSGERTQEEFKASLHTTEADSAQKFQFQGNGIEKNSLARHSAPVPTISLKDPVQNGCDIESYPVSNSPREKCYKLENTQVDITKANINDSAPNCPPSATETNESKPKTTDTQAQPLDSEIIRKTDLTNSISPKVVEDRNRANCDTFNGTPSMDKKHFDSNDQLTNEVTAIKTEVTDALTSAFSMLQKQSDPLKSGISSMTRLNQKQLYGINTLDLAQLASSEDYYRNFLEYCRAVEQRLPYWYDVGYAYSGLHSIIQPPPPEIDLWSSRIVPIFNMNKSEAECEFCFENYAEFKCQFYPKFNPEFAIKNYRNNKLVVCECCDYTDDEEDENAENLDDTKPDLNVGNAKKCEKRAKLDMQILKEPAKIQAGWYGKGYRKNFRKRKR